MLYGSWISNATMVSMIYDDDQQYQQSILISSGYNQILPVITITSIIIIYDIIHVAMGENPLVNIP